MAEREVEVTPVPGTPTLTPEARRLVEAPFLAHLGTVALDGRPHVTPVWIDVDGDDLLFNTAEGRVKVRNIRRNANVTVSIVDPSDPYRVLALQGRVVEITPEGADEHVDKLAKKYLGRERYPFRQPGEQRLKVRVSPERVLMQPPLAT